jgi:hypothetical protein
VTQTKPGAGRRLEIALGIDGGDAPEEGRLIGRSAVGMKPVSLTPSELVPVTRIEPNVEAVEISNR